jgi:hypothetical protein
MGLAVKRILAVCLCAAAGFSEAAENCGLATFFTLQTVVDTCCESTETGNCAEAFPSLCSHSCASSLVPLHDQCDSLIGSFPDDTFTDFSLSTMKNFVPVCRRVLVLYEHGSQGQCADVPDLPKRTEDINLACCFQNGEDVCAGTNGAPQTCDAECGKIFLPYYERCMGGAPSTSHADATASGVFTEMFDACQSLPAAEVDMLIQEVRAQEENDDCQIQVRARLPGGLSALSISHNVEQFVSGA